MIRWGLLSTANINRRLIPAIRASERGELVAVASRSQESADNYAKKWNIPQAFDSYDAMLASDEIDAVYIGLPNHLHAEWTIKALEAGKHVLCEKPFALTVAEVDAVIATAERTGKIVTEAFMYRHHPQMELVKDLLGKLGDIIHVSGHFSFPLTNPKNVRNTPEMGGGCLWDVGIYPLSFAQFIYDGAPVSVSGVQTLSESGVDVDFAGQMTYASGGTAQISSSFRSPFHIFAKVVGTNGRLEIPMPFNGFDDTPPDLFHYNAAGHLNKIAVPSKMLYLGEVEDLHSAILDGTPQRVSLAETRDHVKTAVALYDSAKKNQTITP